MEDEDYCQQQNQFETQETLTLALFDLYWFRHLILLRLPPLPAPPPPDAESTTASPPPSILSRRRSLHRRSLSEDLSPLPTLPIHPPKLQTILSGKEAAISDEIPRFDQNRRRRKVIDWRRRRRRRSESSKSLSDLEFEELKGFMDLGFTFSDAETDPRLMELVPGLQRLKAVAAGDREASAAAVADEEASSSCTSADDVAVSVSRPYLSEAWDAAEEEEEEEEERRLRELRVPIAVAVDGVDLKDQLRFWAHAVASTVR